MKKRISLLLFIVILLLPVTTINAKTPAITASLKSYIQTYGSIKINTQSGVNSYKSSITYQKANKRFQFQCSYSNGRSTSKVRMYMPVSKLKTNYTVYFDETIRASGLTAKISGKANLNRRTYSDQATTLKFSRQNKTSVSRKITNNAYQASANSLLRYAFKLWEKGLETGPTLCFRNFGFSRTTVIDSKTYTKEW
jgi:hypothetical protein